MPPIEVYKVGGLYFVKDGHHRVSVARHRGHDVIEAYVTEVKTRVPLGNDLRRSDLGAKDHERLFLERVPLDRSARERIRFKRDPETAYAELAESVEAWGFRLIQGLGEPRTRVEVATAWFRDEFVPVVEALHDAELIGGRTDAEAYMRVACDRYMLLRTHDWGEAVIERLQKELS